MSLESTSARCERLAQHLFVYGRPLTTEEIIEKIDAIDEAAVMRAARRVIATKPTFAALGPTAALRRLPPIAARFA
jgi:predicted Zn-dependent peptidase